MKLHYKKHFTIHDITQLAQHMVKDKEYSYALLMVIGCTLGYKIGIQLRMDWSCFVDEKGKAKSVIYFEKNETRTVTKFLKSFIEYIYIKLDKPALSTPAFINPANGNVMTTNSLNRDLRKLQEKYQSVVGMPYPLVTDSFRRVFGLSVLEKWNFQQSAIGALRKHFGHNSDKRTREFLMLPEKTTINKVKDLYSSYDPNWRFEDIAL
jgi:hypothetical protein